jgi:uncharacterized SAM-binding protein YcdF (DUF218 family)
MQMRRSNRSRPALLASAVLLPVAIFIAIALLLDEAPRESPDGGGDFDAIVVLGCRVMSGGAPSFALERRAQHAARLYHAGFAPFVITTGGVGDAAPSEADVAAQVLREAGVPPHAILREDASTSTEENAAFAKERFGGRRVLVVSDAFHTWRAERVFARHYEEVVAVGTRSRIPGERLRGTLREVVAVGAYFALGRIELTPRPRRGSARPPPAKEQLAYLKPDLDERATAEACVEYSDRMVDAVALELGKRAPRNALRGFRQRPNDALIRGDEAG